MATAQSSTRTVKTPGENPAATTEITPAADAFQAVAVQTGADAAEGLSNEKLLEMLAAQQRQIELLSAAVNNVARAQGPARAVTEALPSSADIDVATLKAPVLTSEGWLVPETHGSNPAATRI